MNPWGLALRREDVLVALDRGAAAELSGVEPVAHPDGTVHLPREGVLFLWPARPDRFDRPPVAAVPQEEIADFLAWVSTYVPTIRPFTAFTRVVPISDLNASLSERVPSLQGLESAAAGLIVSEALVAANGQMSLSELPVAACESTFFFACSRALAVGLSPPRLGRLFHDWRSLRMLTRQPPREFPEDAAAHLQETLTALLPGGASERGSLASAACRELFADGDVEAKTWVELVGDAKDLIQGPAEMQGPREQRVRYLARVIPKYASEGPDRMCALGYLLALFDGGADLNVHLVPRSPHWGALLMWYGFVAGLLRQNSIEAVGGGLGRRLIRDMLQADSIFDPPRSDIAFEELAIYLSGPRPVDDFRSGSGSSLTVELAPRVPVLVKWSGRGREPQQPSTMNMARPPESVPAQQAGLFTPDEDLRGRLLKELGDTLDRARYLQERLASLPLDSRPSGKGYRRKR